MKLASYVKILTATVIVGCVATLGVRFTERGAKALWVLATSSPSQVVNPDVTERTPASRAGVTDANDADDLRPILPEEFIAIPGQRFSLYYDGLITARDPDRYAVEVTSATLRGSSERRYWTVEPTKADVGRHSVTVTVRSLANGSELAKGSTWIVVTDPPKPQSQFNVLIVGASNTHQAIMPNALWTRLDRWDPGRVAFVGSEPLKADFSFYRAPLEQLRYEGLGGWGWQTFASHYMPGKEDLYKLPKSPFVFLEDGKPKLDVGRYLDEKGLRGKLGVVVFDLGVNETFAVDPNDSKSMEASFGPALEWADKLILAFRAAAPEAKIVVGIPAPFTRSEPVFMKRYGQMKPEYGDPWRHRRVILALARRMIAHFGQNSLGVILAPLYPAIDVIDGYWQIDPGHPNDFGADQMAAVFQAAIMRSLDPG